MYIFHFCLPSSSGWSLISLPSYSLSGISPISSLRIPSPLSVYPLLSQSTLSSLNLPSPLSVYPILTLSGTSRISSLRLPSPLFTHLSFSPLYPTLLSTCHLSTLPSLPVYLSTHKNLPVCPLYPSTPPDYIVPLSLPLSLPPPSLSPLHVVCIAAC